MVIADEGRETTSPVDRIKEKELGLFQEKKKKAFRLEEIAVVIGGVKQTLDRAAVDVGPRESFYKRQGEGGRGGVQGSKGPLRKRTAWLQQHRIEKDPRAFIVIRTEGELRRRRPRPPGGRKVVGSR